MAALEFNIIPSPDEASHDAELYSDDTFSKPIDAQSTLANWYVQYITKGLDTVGTEVKVTSSSVSGEKFVLDRITLQAIVVAEAGAGAAEKKFTFYALFQKFNGKELNGDWKNFGET